MRSCICNFLFGGNIVLGYVCIRRGPFFASEHSFTWSYWLPIFYWKISVFITQSYNILPSCVNRTNIYIITAQNISNYNIMMFSVALIFENCKNGNRWNDKFLYLAVTHKKISDWLEKHARSPRWIHLLVMHRMVWIFASQKCIGIRVQHHNLIDGD